MSGVKGRIVSGGCCLDSRVAEWVDRGCMKGIVTQLGNIGNCEAMPGTVLPLLYVVPPYYVRRLQYDKYSNSSNEHDLRTQDKLCRKGKDHQFFPYLFRT